MLPDLSPPTRLERPTTYYRLDDKGSIIEKCAIAGTLIGIAVMLPLTLASHSYTLISELGFFYSLALGAILGCMISTLIGCVVAGIISERNI